MQEAFTGVAQGLDIFEAAAALADTGRAAAGEQLTTEMVFLADFMADVLVSGCNGDREGRGGGSDDLVNVFRLETRRGGDRPLWLAG